MSASTTATEEDTEQLRDLVAATLDKEGISVSLMCQVFKGWCNIYRNGRVLMNKTVVKALDSRVALLKMTAACQC